MSIEDNTIDEIEAFLTAEPVTVYNQDETTGRSIGIRFLFEEGHGSDILDVLGVFYREPEALMSLFNTTAATLRANEDASVVERINAIQSQIDSETVEEEN